MKFFRFTPKRVVLWLVVCLLAAWLISVFWPLGRVPLEVSRETTYFLEPLRADGTVDYAAAINRQKPAVPPDQNAAVALLRIRTVYSPALPRRFYKLLGADPVAEDKPYFVEDEPFAVSYLGIELTEDELRLSGKTPRLPRERRPQWQAAMAKTRERPWSAKEFPVIAAWLKENEEQLGALTEAGDRPRWYWPRVVGPDQTLFEAPYPAAQALRDAASALLRRSLLKWHQQDQAGAWDDIVAIHRLARRLAGDEMFLLRAVGAIWRGQASEAVLALLRHPDLDTPLAQTMLNELQSLEPWPNLGPALLRERLTLLDGVQYIYRSGSPRAAGVRMPALWLARGVDVNRTLRRANKYFDGCVVGAGGETVDEQLTSIQKVAESAVVEIPQWDRALVRVKLHATPAVARRRIASDAIADMVVSNTLIRWESLVLLDAEGRASFDLARVGLALHLYKLDRGGYPDTLEALAPDYLPALPTDPFSEGTFRYERINDGYVLYSIGRNFADDGGKARDPDDDDDQYDIVLRVE